MSEWYNFKNGVKVSDLRINNWIDELLERVDEEDFCGSIASGDAFVCVQYAMKEPEVVIVVATSDGYQEISILRGESCPRFARDSELTGNKNAENWWNNII